MLESGFNGFPRASRSARARGFNGKKFESGQNRPFDILASVAGKLLDKSWDRFCCACDDNDSSSKKLCDQEHHGHDIDGDFGRATMIDSSNTNNNNNNSNNNVTCFRGDIEESTKEEESETVTDISRNQKMSEVSNETRCENKDEKQLEDIYDEKEKIRRTNLENSQKIFPFKKRKFFNNYPLSNSDRKEHFNPPENRITVKACAASQQIGPKSPECNVKLSIKSFKVPELFIDISTHATVGSLKKTVMEAVTSILGDGLQVGILVQGKRVRDDNKTLFQTGISQDDKCHNLGFVLEPKHSKTTIHSSLKNTEPSFSKSRSQGLNRRCVSLGSQQGTSKTSPSCVESDISEGSENVADDSSNNMDANSKALVTYVPRMGVKALTAVPLHRKSGHHEYGQRRIRRPFSVTEVEALVRAVEKLGTGRWRDVKFHAFDNAKHRTYVDLKDKWKTLVHTARISPQQRRGEPVPQELLDRVLAAQAYWSHRQAKQHAMLTV